MQYGGRVLGQSYRQTGDFTTYSCCGILLPTMSTWTTTECTTRQALPAIHCIYCCSTFRYIGGPAD
eukprot:3059656-Pyramimonas_sp.AAC.1